MTGYRITLAKEDFHFSCAHFTLFGTTTGELLHGHNYRVEVDVWGGELDELGLLVNIQRLKGEVRKACARLDGRTLLPRSSPHLAWRQEGDSVEVTFADRAYRLPANDVVLVPVVNTTIELLACMLWQELVPALAGSLVEELGVVVEETPGQRCRYESGLGVAG